MHRLCRLSSFGVCSCGSAPRRPWSTPPPPIALPRLSRRLGASLPPLFPQQSAPYKRHVVRCSLRRQFLRRPPSPGARFGD